ncbi:MAG: hypothetical protein LBT53_08465 [Puniceicoccales bacterium]|jgi:hypothetical protein|nr:hypothetical protein [Puniceicoccales bacterium]
MLRLFASLFLLLAYTASTGHCAIAAALCGSVHAADAHAVSGDIGGHHAGHLPHDASCSVDNPLALAANSRRTVNRSASFSPEKNFASTAAPHHFACPPCLADFAAPPENGLAPHDRDCDRLLALAAGWQFSVRAAGTARAPNA